MPRDAQSGFSLIETLVAMAVLAVSATAILSATETHTHTVAAVTDRTVARWVAQNSMVDAQSRRQVPDRVEMGPKAWLVRVDQSATADPDLGRVDITVATAAIPDVVLARLTGFVDLAGEVAE
ncbi:MAG: type II secretion system minor pseudopilin GspI [Pseudomonadota bacterium]